MDFDALNRWISPLRLRLAALVGRGVLTTVDDTGKAQRVQLELLAGEVRAGLERLQAYGFTSHPQTGAEAITLNVGAIPGHQVVIMVDDRRYRLTGLDRGEVAVYDDLGSSIVLRRGNKIEVTAAAKVLVTAPEVEISASTKATVTGDLDVTGTVAVGGDIKADGDVAAGDISLTSHLHASGTLTAGSTPVTGITGAAS